MRIAIDALGIHDFGGGRTATLNLLAGLLALDTRNHYRVYLSQREPSLESVTGNLQQVIAPFKNRFLMRLWAQVFFPFLTRKDDLIHYAKNLGVFGIHIPSIVTMYDLTTLVHAELFPWIDVWYWKNIQKLTLQKARRIIAISEATARDIAEYYQISPSKIKVIYPSIDPQFHPVAPGIVAETRQRYGLPERYLLHVGRIDRKKNLTMLVQAFSRCQETEQLKLVLVGHVYQKSQDLDLIPTIERLGMKEKVIFTGRAPDADLPAIYSGALAAVFPSLHEGFGLTPLEALACGIPLITHRAGAVQEAVGDAAIILERLSVDDLAQAIIRVVQDVDLRQELRRCGIERAAKYQREKNARETIALYQEVAHENTR